MPAVINNKKITRFRQHLPVWIALLICGLCFLQAAGASAQIRDSTAVSGRLTDAISGQALPLVSIRFADSRYGAVSDEQGRFSLSAPGNFVRILFSRVGYRPLSLVIRPGRNQTLNATLQPEQTALREVGISGGHKRYRNKGNPAVELIRQVIAHKAENRMENAEYLQYDAYERLGIDFTNLPHKLTSSRLFRSYRFMLDSVRLTSGERQNAFPVYFSEKLFRNYQRKSPSKNIAILQAQRQINLVKFIDTAGVDIYLNRLYGNRVDIYENNVFVLTNQLLSPIADHSPDFYKFFIRDTLKSANGRLVEMRYLPRNKGDLLFEGLLTIALDDNYAVTAAEMKVDRQINLNFIRGMELKLNYRKSGSGRYYLDKSDVRADFGVLRNKSIGVLGQRTVVYSNYIAGKPMEPGFYRGPEERSTSDSDRPDSNFWAAHRPDTLPYGQARAYQHMNRLQQMKSFQLATWLAATLTTNYADLGPVQLGQFSDAFAFDNVEGPRFQLGGRTTPELNQNWYADAYLGYGTQDRQWKYNFSAYYAFNKIPPYRYPNDYLRASYQYDLSVPGQDFSINSSQPPIASLQSGSSNYFLYSRIVKLDYAKEYPNHFSFDLGFKNWERQAAGTLVYRLNDPGNTLVDHLTTSEFNLSLRYAPHEQIIQGATDRRTIYSPYPIINLQLRQGLRGVINGSYNFSGATLNIAKRFYLSQLGYADITILGNILLGKLPFPLLNICPANESPFYDPDAYNQMYYLEFVSDHYAGINLTQSFNGFFLNKIPLVKHLKWREYLSFKALYGGLRRENDPLSTSGLLTFPVAGAGANGTYALGRLPYLEAGAGIGNIFKVLRIDVIRRLNYLDHPGVSAYGVKFSFGIDF